MKIIAGLIAGLLFGVGLAASGMTNTAKVIGFLDIFGAWDIDLLFVMGGAVVTTAIGYTLVLRRSAPLLDKEFYLPLSNVIDRKLLIGASIFGFGWALYGYCPGPAIAALVYLAPATWVFVAFMILGMFLGGRLAARF